MLPPVIGKRGVASGDFLSLTSSPRAASTLHHHLLQTGSRLRHHHQHKFLMSRTFFPSARSIASSIAPRTRPLRLAYPARLSFRSAPFSTSTAAMAPNKTALDFVDFVNASPTRRCYIFPN